MNKISDFFSTSDIGVTTVLSLYYPVYLIDKSDPTRAVFFFKRESGLDELIQSYWNRELKIEPQLLLSQRRQIQRRLNEI